jgi:hypothetical protein
MTAIICSKIFWYYNFYYNSLETCVAITFYRNERYVKYHVVVYILVSA